MNRIFKTLLLISLIGFLSYSLTSCKCCHKNCKKTETTKQEENPYTFGTVKKLPNIIGKCAWVVETDAGKRFETRDMPQDFFVDGLKIKFKYSVIEGMMSTCQVGTIVRVSDVSKQ